MILLPFSLAEGGTSVNIQDFYLASSPPGESFLLVSWGLKWNTCRFLMVFSEWVIFTICQPQHDKTSKMTCAPSEDSDQPAHPRSLIWVFACAHWKVKDPRFLHADSEDWSDWRLPRLIWVFAGHTGHFCWFCHVQACVCFLRCKFLPRLSWYEPATHLA